MSRLALPLAIDARSSSCEKVSDSPIGTAQGTSITLDHARRHATHLSELDREMLAAAHFFLAARRKRSERGVRSLLLAVSDDGARSRVEFIESNDLRISHGRPKKLEA